jgi:hypothetical protein
MIERAVDRMSSTSAIEKRSGVPARKLPAAFTGLDLRFDAVGRRVHPHTSAELTTTFLLGDKRIADRGRLMTVR